MATVFSFNDSPSGNNFHVLDSLSECMSDLHDEFYLFTVLVSPSLIFNWFAFLFFPFAACILFTLLVDLDAVSSSRFSFRERERELVLITQFLKVLLAFGRYRPIIYHGVPHLLSALIHLDSFVMYIPHVLGYFSLLAIMLGRCGHF